MEVKSKLPNNAEVILAYNEADRVEKQQSQDAYLQSELKEHIIESIKIRSKYLDVMKEAALIAKQKPMINYITEWVEKARVISEREYVELNELKKTNPQLYPMRYKEVENARNRRAAAYQKLQEKVKNIKVEIEQSIADLKVADLEKMKTSGIITDLTIDKLNRKVTYTCKECAKTVELTYNDVPAIYYGTQVEGVNVPIVDFSRRIKLPMFKCSHCGKYHIFPYQVMTNLKEFAKVYLEKHAKTYRKFKDGAPKLGMAYVLANEIYAPCLAIKIDTNIDSVSNMLSKISNEKLEMAKSLENGAKGAQTTEESDDIFDQLMNIYEEEVAVEQNTTENAIENATEDINLDAKPIDDLENLKNKDMLPNLNQSLLAYQDNVVYESYEVEDLNSLTFEELTAYGKLYSLEIQLYLSDKDPNTFTGDIYDLLVPKTADGGNEILPRAIIESIDARYTPFQEVDVLNMFNL